MRQCRKFNTSSLELTDKTKKSEEHDKHSSSSSSDSDRDSDADEGGKIHGSNANDFFFNGLIRDITNVMSVNYVYQWYSVKRYHF